MKKTMILTVDYSDYDSLIEAENKKTKLENDGWEYVKTERLSFDEFRLTYEK